MCFLDDEELKLESWNDYKMTEKLLKVGAMRSILQDTMPIGLKVDIVKLLRAYIFPHNQSISTEEDNCMAILIYNM